MRDAMSATESQWTHRMPGIRGSGCVSLTIVVFITNIYLSCTKNITCWKLEFLCASLMTPTETHQQFNQQWEVTAMQLSKNAKFTQQTQQQFYILAASCCHSCVTQRWTSFLQVEKLWPPGFVAIILPFMHARWVDLCQEAYFLKQECLVEQMAHLIANIQNISRFLKVQLLNASPQNDLHS